MIKLNENSKRAVSFKNAFRSAIANGMIDLHDWYKNPSQSKIRAYENLKDLYFDAKAVAVTSANCQTFTFMVLCKDALYVHTLFNSYRIPIADFMGYWNAL